MTEHHSPSSPASGPPASSAPKQPSGSTAEELFALVPRLFHAFRPQPPSVEAGGESALPEFRGQFRVLGELVRNGPMTMSDLAASMQVAPPTATGIVNRLESQELVQRRSDQQDRRTTWVEINADGQAHLDAFLARGKANLTRRLDALSPDERTSLQGAMSALRKLADQGRTPRDEQP